MPAAETHPPARTLLMVRTGTSVLEMKVSTVAREPSRSNPSLGFGPSQQLRILKLVHNLPIRVPNLELAQVQLLHVLFDLRAVAHGNPHHLACQNHFFSLPLSF